MSLFFVIVLPSGQRDCRRPADPARNAEPRLAALFSLAGLVRMALLFPDVREGGVVREEIAWLPSFGISLVARVDGFAWMFAMLIFGYSRPVPVALGLLAQCDATFDPQFDQCRPSPLPQSSRNCPKNEASSSCASSGNTFETYWSGRTTTIAPFERRMPRRSKMSGPFLRSGQ